MNQEEARAMAVGLWSLVELENDKEYSEEHDVTPVHLLLDKVRLDWDLAPAGRTLEPSDIDMMFRQLVTDLADFIEEWKVDNFEGYEYNMETVKKNAGR